MNMQIRRAFIHFSTAYTFPSSQDLTQTCLYYTTCLALNGPRADDVIWAFSK